MTTVVPFLVSAGGLVWLHHLRQRLRREFGQHTSALPLEGHEFSDLHQGRAPVHWAAIEIARVLMDCHRGDASRVAMDLLMEARAEWSRAVAWFEVVRAIHRLQKPDVSPALRRRRHTPR